MIEQSLSKLYRRMNVQGQAGAAELFDADTLVAAAAGTLSGDRRDEVAARLSRSAAQTDLVRMLHELTADATVVADAVNTRASLAHVRAGRRVRHVADKAYRHAASIRWVALAASLVLVFGFVFWQPQSDPSANNAMTAVAKPDRIFTSQDRIFAAVEVSTAHSGSDGVFQSNFNDG